MGYMPTTRLAGDRPGSASPWQSPRCLARL